jgi:putative addiction module component (TIGR02574 family)
MYTAFMTRADVEQLLNLPAEERLQLAQMLWESVEPEDEAHFVPIPDWQRQILSERLADLERNPTDEQPWEEVREEIWRDE